MNLKEKILELKEKKNAIILAHYYQTSDIQDIADFLGDSLQLARAAENANAKIILFAGVHFMAETAKLLNPEKKVLIPDLDAGCSLSDSCPPDLFKQFKDSLPDHKVVSYINCSAEIKALSDVICTSSNAMAIVNSFPPDQPLIFAPDKNLGAYINEQTGRNMVLWNGSCMVHEIFSIEKLLKLKIGHPQAKIIAHPECEADLLKHADYIGSTTQLLKFTQTDPGTEYIVVTETGIIHQMILASPEKSFIPAPPNNSCACNDCPHMKKNTLEKIYMSLQNEEPAIDLHPRLMAQAIKPLKKMLNISQTAGII
jgi:quinolinate synthase